MENEIIRKISRLQLLFCYPVWRILNDGSLDLIGHEWFSKEAKELNDEYYQLLEEIRKHEHEEQENTSTRIAAGRTE